ncbi:MAG: hypothetical protein QOG69_2056 [Actinomycetota bacterium]|nr:hypothetical protein [Actinomycetota bacterium]
MAGADRIATAIAVSQAGFPIDHSAAVVVLARADQFTDALAGGPLAARFDGPLLLTTSAGITAAVATEIARVLPANHTVYLLGGSQALAAGTEAQITSLGFIPMRFPGVDRYDTAIKIAQYLGGPNAIFEADGTSFPDGLSAGPAAAMTQGVVVLTEANHLPAATSTYLATHSGVVRYAIGGPAAAADPQAQAIVGADRYETSVAVARKFFTSPATIGTASGAAFPDALSGGPVSALANGPLVLVPPGGTLPASAQAYFAGLSNTVVSAWLFGDTGAVSTAMANQIAQALVLVPPPS